MLREGEGAAPAGMGRRGTDTGVLGVIERGDVLVMGSSVREVTRSGEPPSAVRQSVGANAIEIDARGRVLMPGFVDCHTHACWGGGDLARADEWEMKLADRTYQEIAAAGGGIRSTVRATREASVGELACDLIGRADRMARLGTTTLEVKTGYGLTLEHELKMLEAIGQAENYVAGTLAPTALLGHAIDPEAGSSARFVDETIERTLPAVSRAAMSGLSDQGPLRSLAVDAFCESGIGAWSVEDTVRLLSAAKALGHPVRVHADQFTSLGMIGHAVRMGARSVDHLEASTDADLRLLGGSTTFGVGLPICGLHLDGRYARLGELARHGGRVCIATNFNPGSAPSPSMPLAIALAVRFCGLSVEQALVAATLNPAILLGYADRGYIAAGARADLLLLREPDERVLAYELGDNPVDMVIAGGERLE